MARFYGEVGFADKVQTAPGVWDNQIVKKNYYGDVLRVSRRLSGSSEHLHDNLTVSNQISIVADAYAEENFFSMVYVQWAGTRWKVSDVEVQRPRLILSLGEVYNGSIN